MYPCNRWYYSYKSIPSVRHDCCCSSICNYCFNHRTILVSVSLCSHCAAIARRMYYCLYRCLSSLCSHLRAAVRSLQVRMLVFAQVLLPMLSRNGVRSAIAPATATTFRILYTTVDITPYDNMIVLEHSITRGGILLGVWCVMCKQ